MKRLLPLLVSGIIMLSLAMKSNAQSSLVHYWNFNDTMAAMYTDTIHGIKANYSTLDTNKAQILYAEVPGTSSFFSTYVDYVAVSSTSPDYDTVNERFGDSSGHALRLRNPSDSMQLLFYIPSAHYTHIVLKDGAESSSLTHGMTYEDYSYSVDSGLTWRTSGLSKLSDSIWLTFHRNTISLAGDSSVKDNDKLVFRIIFSGNTTGTSGNNRIDNVTVEGDTIRPSSVTVTSAPAGAICAGTSVRFTASAVINIPNTTPVYQWYVNGTAAGTDSIGYTTAALTPGSTVYCVVTDSADGSVVATSNTLIITVTPAPSAGVITGPSNVCPTSAITLTDAVSGGTWSASNGFATITTGGVVTGVSTGLDTIKYTFTNSCGTADTTFVVNINTTPSAGTIGGPSIVCIGASDTLTETISGGTWTASNSNASVSAAGVVTGSTSGADTIIYTVATCGTSSVTYPVTVNVMADAGTISGASSVCADSTIVLSESVTGGAWSNTNSNASVSVSGVVTGISAGTDTIMYSVTNICGTVSASVPVTINTVINPGVISGPDTVCLGHTITLTDGASGGVWAASDANATVSRTGLVSGITVGADSVVYGFENVCGYSYTFHNIYVSDNGSCATGVSQVNLPGGSLRVYPNPASGSFMINCTTVANEKAQVTITNIVGEKIGETTISTNAPQAMILDQPDGVYIINVVTSNGKYTSRIILAH